ncbi:MAG: hypothetical protein K2M82_07155 [Lachnospiraceae bacterium]|nr:hypothetical protein [Lachnospiraceae bacterium]
MFGKRVIKSKKNLYILDYPTSHTLSMLDIMGVFAVFLAASALHFVYKLSGEETWAIIFGAVNESTWEHIKIFTLPYVLWSFIELAYVRMPFKRFVVSKVMSLYFLMLSIPLFFYGYTSVLGHSILWLDILSGFVFTALSFVISYKLMSSSVGIERLFYLSLAMLIIYYFMFAYFTAVPPKMFLFKDPVTGGYGIPPRE